MPRSRIPRAVGALLGLLLAFHMNGQKKHAEQNAGHPVARKVDPQAPCKFAAEYWRIRSNKADPRVAFIELDKLTKNTYRDTDLAFLQPLGFENACKAISNQIEETKAFFDQARGYLYVEGGEGDMDGDEALAYFSEHAPKSGITLLSSRFFDGFNVFALAYHSGQWQNVTSHYLGSLQLSEYDYVVVPQYGRTARVMTYDPKNSEFHHKLWLHWDGVKFQPTIVKPTDWRCPDVYNKHNSICGN
jgi:hypothetical protein